METEKIKKIYKLYRELEELSKYKLFLNTHQKGKYKMGSEEGIRLDTHVFIQRGNMDINGKLAKIEEQFEFPLHMVKRVFNLIQERIEEIEVELNDI